jgi:predicted extracellular nuclease
MMKYLFLMFCLLSSLSALSGEPFRIVFYNVENFFDYRDDSAKSDEEFLPGGLRGWTPARFYDKAGKISKVISAVGRNRFPDLVGLAEVENDRCLATLTKGSPLRNAGYSFIHLESSDTRGVDVALLYNKYRFNPIGYSALTPRFEGEPGKKTRDILHVWGNLDGKVLLNVFVCHFPSRLGGDAESETYRRQVAVMLRTVIDSLFSVDETSNILIMGDFNDGPDDLSISTDLKALPPSMLGQTGVKNLFNKMLELREKSMPGTHKNQGEWGFLDQIIVSGNMLRHSTQAGVLMADFLLCTDERWMGKKPFRTFNGYRWQGGFSDHLPIWTELLF